MRGSIVAGLAFACVAVVLVTPAQAGSKIKQQGLASWYKMGTHTASGERYDPMGITAAHPSLPFGTKVRVTNPDSGDSVVVRINDRGPFAGGRIIDLSLGAAKAIGLVRAGVAPVNIAVVDSAAEAEQAPEPQPAIAEAESVEAERAEASAEPAPATSSSSWRWSHIDVAHR